MASARFRIKKKQRTLQLERTVSDLSSRAEELEREATELRRENGWLKELVMLKGGRLGGVDFSRSSTGYYGGEPSTSQRRRTQAEGEEEEDSDGSDSHQEDTGSRKTKGKGKGKGRSKR